MCLLCRSGVRRETHRHTSRRCVIMCLFSCDTTPALLGAFFAAKIPSRISFFHTVHRLERFCVFCLCVSCLWRATTCPEGEVCACAPLQDQGVGEYNTRTHTHTHTTHTHTHTPQLTHGPGSRSGSIATSRHVSNSRMRPSCVGIFFCVGVCVVVCACARSQSQRMTEHPSSARVAFPRIKRVSDHTHGQSKGRERTNTQIQKTTSLAHLATLSARLARA